MKNKGKIFEEEIKESVPKNIFYYRIKDPAQGFGGGEGTRFSSHNICDIFLYKFPNLIALELKSTEKPSIPFSLEENKAGIKKCQIDGLLECKKHEGVIAGLLLNFRTQEKTYFLEIGKFMNFARNTKKKSISISDTIAYGGKEIDSFKKRTRYTYDLNPIWRK